MNLTQRRFGNSISDASFSLPAQYIKKYYGADPFGAGKAKDLATKNKLLEKIVKNLIEADKIRDERFGKRF